MLKEKAKKVTSKVKSSIKKHEKGIKHIGGVFGWAIVFGALLTGVGMGNKLLFKRFFP